MIYDTRQHAAEDRYGDCGGGSVGDSDSDDGDVGIVRDSGNCDGDMGGDDGDHNDDGIIDIVVIVTLLVRAKEKRWQWP